MNDHVHPLFADIFARSFGLSNLPPGVTDRDVEPPPEGDVCCGTGVDDAHEHDDRCGQLCGTDGMPHECPVCRGSGVLE